MIMKLIAFILTSFLLANGVAWTAVAGDKVKAEEIVARHLEALGSAEARRPSRSRIAGGGSLMNLRTGGRGSLSGSALLASQDEKVLLKAEFSSPSYPFERFTFDGQKFNAKQYAPGVRSPLAEFLLSHDTVFSEGLFGGTLSSAWPLLDLSARKAKLEYGGTDKIDGRQAYKLKYMPRGGSEVRITIFLDAENYQHLRTEYERVIAAPMTSSPSQSASQRESRYKLVEDFRDFRAEGGLTLPHTYKLEYSVFRLNKPLALDWTLTLTQFTFDYPIEAKEFLADN